MDDLIRKEDAIKAIASLLAYHGAECAWIDQKEALGKLEELPSAERVGHWYNKPNVYGVAYCSECDYELHTDNTNYCPNCGCRMKGEEE